MSMLRELSTYIDYFPRSFSTVVPNVKQYDLRDLSIFSDNSTVSNESTPPTSTYSLSSFFPWVLYTPPETISEKPRLHDNVSIVSNVAPKLLDGKSAMVGIDVNLKRSYLILRVNISNHTFDASGEDISRTIQVAEVIFANRGDNRVYAAEKVLDNDRNVYDSTLCGPHNRKDGLTKEQFKNIKDLIAGEKIRAPSRPYSAFIQIFPPPRGK